MSALITKIGIKYYYGHINLTKAINEIINEEKLKVKEAIMKQINKRPSGNPEIDAYINGIQLMEDLGIRK